MSITTEWWYRWREEYAKELFNEAQDIEQRVAELHAEGEAGKAHFTAGMAVQAREAAEHFMYATKHCDLTWDGALDKQVR